METNTSIIYLIKRFKGLQRRVSHVHNTMATIVHRNSLKTTKTNIANRDYINKLMPQYGLQTWQRRLTFISLITSNLKVTKSPSLNCWLFENSPQLQASFVRSMSPKFKTQRVIVTPLSPQRLMVSKSQRLRNSAKSTCSAWKNKNKILDRIVW